MKEKREHRRDLLTPPVGAWGEECQGAFQTFLPQPLGDVWPRNLRVFCVQSLDNDDSELLGARIWWKQLPIKGKNRK